MVCSAMWHGHSMPSSGQCRGAFDALHGAWAVGQSCTAEDTSCGHCLCSCSCACAAPMINSWLQAARQRLDTAEALLQGEHGAHRLHREHAALVGRQCWMVAQLGAIFQVRPRTGRHWPKVAQHGSQMGLVCPSHGVA